MVFIKDNSNQIDRFKFFGGEPLLAFEDIKEIITQTHDYIGENYEIVTNTTLLKPEIWKYMKKYFSLLFFSIDSENIFSYDRIVPFVKEYGIEKKLYFNLVISPGKEYIALEQFEKLYWSGMRGFNILPVYFTKKWNKKDLSNLSVTMKTILDYSLRDKYLRLYGFQENLGYDTSLANNTIFIDIDGSIYYSDIVSTFFWKEFKENLYLWNIEDFDLSCLDVCSFKNEKKYISSFEGKIYNTVLWQRELHLLMDYFSHYLNIQNEKQTKSPSERRDYKAK